MLNWKKDIKNIEVKERLVKRNLTKDFILSIVGPRRAGKTYFLYHIIKNMRIENEDYLFVNFEEIEENLESFINKHQEIYGKLPQFLFLDEIRA